ncbi:hypothetical protein F5141DRAFT_1065657 [Pisolithus sp. B1]|nr:hypothetical protein F5141DRAFT_1065657 [Pisolithus sp. B1]
MWPDPKTLVKWSQGQMLDWGFSPSVGDFLIIMEMQCLLEIIIFCVQLGVCCKEAITAVHKRMVLLDQCMYPLQFSKTDKVNSSAYFLGVEMGYIVTLVGPYAGNLKVFNEEKHKTTKTGASRY